MRHHFTRAASSGIDWSLPQTVEAWSDSTGDYTMTSEGHPSQGLSLSTAASPNGRAGSVKSVGRTTTNNEPSTILRGYKIDPGSLVLAGGRTYRIDGTAEVDTTTGSPYDPWKWGIYLNCYRNADHTDLIERITVIEFPRPSVGVDALETYDENITLPSGTRSIEHVLYEKSIKANAVPGSAFFTYENTIALVT